MGGLLDELQRAAPASAKSYGPRFPIHVGMLAAGVMELPRMLERNPGLILSLWVGSSLHIG